MHEISTWSPRPEGGHPRANGVDHADTLVAEDAPRRTGGDIALEDV